MCDKWCQKCQTLFLANYLVVTYLFISEFLFLLGIIVCSFPFEIEIARRNDVFSLNFDFFFNGCINAHAPCQWIQQEEGATKRKIERTEPTVERKDSNGCKPSGCRHCPNPSVADIRCNVDQLRNLVTLIIRSRERYSGWFFRFSFPPDWMKRRQLHSDRTRSLRSFLPQIYYFSSIKIWIVFIRFTAAMYGMLLESVQHFIQVREFHFQLDWCLEKRFHSLIGSYCDFAPTVCL